MTTTQERNTSALLHLSALTQYLIPFGNYIFPIVIWSSKKNESEFIDYNGKQVLNFQLSIFLYTVILCMIAVPIFIYTVFKSIPLHSIIHKNDIIIENLSLGNITGLSILGIIAALTLCFIKIIEFILIIYAAVKASNGEMYKYPLIIFFLK